MKSFWGILFLAVAGTGWSTPENIALHKPCTVSRAPNYHLCTDADDLKQLTDGIYSQGYFWTQKSTVGWTRSTPVILTIDLGKVEPVRGISWSCAAGVAGVTWPECLYVLVSNDRKQWTCLDDLCVRKDGAPQPPGNGYAPFRYTTDALKGYGRYVAVVAAAENFCFVDEVEVWRGEDGWLQEPLQGEATDSPGHFYAKHCIQSGVSARLRADLQTIVTQADTLPNAAVLAAIKLRANALSEKIPLYAKEFSDEQRTILPYDGLHREVLALHAQVLRAAGIKAPLLWQNNRWDPLALTELPPEGAEINSLSLDLMRGEVRGATFNITQPQERPLKVAITVTGLPKPLNIELREVLFTDTKSRQPVAAALQLLEPDSTGAVYITVPGGCTRQVWISCRRPQGAARSTQGALNLVSSDGTFRKTVPLHIRLRNLDFPAHPALHVGGWDYIQGNAGYYKAPGNLKSNLALMRDMYVDSPWATAAVFPKGATFDATGELQDAATLDFAIWDGWVERWNGARNYCVFFSVGSSFNGEKMGTPRFNTMVGSWLKAWVRHLVEQGLKPDQLVILLVDEPHELEQDKTIVTWAAAVKAADQGVVLFVDPTYTDPHKGNPAMFAANDILCPNTPMLLAQGQPFRDFYTRQREMGKTLWLYSCSGPAKTLDPISYHRAQAWQAFQMGAQGSFFWAFGCGGGIGDSWHAYSQAHTEYSPYFVGPKSVTEGKHSEAIREGVQDYETLLMLRKTVQNVRKAGGNAAWLTQAEKILSEGVAEVLQSVTAANLSWQSPKDRSLMDTLRIRILDALEQAPRN